MNNNEESRKGFAGLDSMVSDVDTKPPVPQPKKESTPQPAQSKSIPDRVDEPANVFTGKQGEGTPGDTGKYWLIGIGVVILFIWLGSSKQEVPRTAAPTSSYSPPSSSYSPPAQEPAAAPPQPAGNEEQMPPAGTGMTLNSSQIRYCLSQTIRIDAWKSAVNSYSQNSVNAFNEAINDYNARCSNFRYRRGSLESIRSEVESSRFLLQQEGQAKAMENP